MVARNTREPLYQQVAQSLKEQIRSGSMAPGDKLPSERELCQQYDVSQITVRRALRELAHREQVYSQHGLGWFVGDAPAAESWRERVALIVDEMTWPATSLAMGLAAALEDVQMGLELWSWPQQPPDGLSRRDSGLLLYCPSGERARALERCSWLKDSGTRVLMVGLALDEDPTLGVFLDLANASRAATEHLLGMGRVRLAYLGAGPLSTLGHQAYWPFAEALWASGLDLPLEHVLDSGDDACHRRLAGLLSTIDRPDGIICATVGDAVTALSAIYAAGLRCPDPVALACLQDGALLEDVTPTITGYRFDMEGFTRVVAHSVQQMLTGDDAGILRVTGELTPRASSVT